MYYVYILQWSQCYYVWQTNNIERRYNQHISWKVQSTSYMWSLQLIWYFTKQTRSEAMKLEKMIKRNWHIQHWINHQTFIKV